MLDPFNQFLIHFDPSYFNPVLFLVHNFYFTTPVLKVCKQGDFKMLLYLIHVELAIFWPCIYFLLNEDTFYTPCIFSVYFSIRMPITQNLQFAVGTNPFSWHKAIAASDISSLVMGWPVGGRQVSITWRPSVSVFKQPNTQGLQKYQKTGCFISLEAFFFRTFFIIKCLIL